MKPYDKRFSSQLQDQLEFEEGKENEAYPDTNKILTIGIGHNLQASPNWSDGSKIQSPLTDTQVYQLLAEDLIAHEKQLTHEWLNFSKMSEGPRKDAIRAMCFQLGIAGFTKFVTLKQLCEQFSWEEAAVAGINSAWAREVPKRAGRVMQQLASGMYYPVPGGVL